MPSSQQSQHTRQSVSDIYHTTSSALLHLFHPSAAQLFENGSAALMRDLNWIQLNVARAFRPSGTLQTLR